MKIIIKILYKNKCFFFNLAQFQWCQMEVNFLSCFSQQTTSTLNFSLVSMCSVLCFQFLINNTVKLLFILIIMPVSIHFNILKNPESSDLNINCYYHIFYYFIHILQYFAMDAKNINLDCEFISYNVYKVLSILQIRK